MNNKDFEKILEEKGSDFVLKNLGFMLTDDQKQHVDFMENINRYGDYLENRDKFIKLTDKQKELAVNRSLERGCSWGWWLLHQDYIDLNSRQRKEAINNALEVGYGYKLFAEFHKTLTKDQKDRAVLSAVDNDRQGEYAFDLLIECHALLTPKQRNLAFGRSVLLNKGYVLITHYPSLLTRKQRKVAIHYLETGELDWDLKKEEK